MRRYRVGVGSSPPLEPPRDNRKACRGVLAEDEQFDDYNYIGRLWQVPLEFVNDY